MKTALTPKHAHPITIVYNLKQFFALIIIPFIRGFLSALEGDLAGWARGAWMDILIVFLMISLSVLNWWYYTYSYDETAIYLSKGWFQTSKTTLPWRQVATISLVERFFLRPVGAVYFRIDSLGGNKRKTDVVIYLTKEEAHDIITADDILLGSTEIISTYTPPFSSILLLSSLSSSSFASVIYLATFVSQSGKLVGQRFQDMLIGTLEEAARTWALRIPPAAMAIALFFIFAWIVGFVLTVFRYRNFKVARTQESVKIGGGLFTNREYSIHQRQINYLDVRQTLATYLVKRYSMYVCVVGNGKERNDISCVIPLERQLSFKNIRHKIFPTMRDSSLQIRPAFKGIMRYLRDPLILCGSIPLTMLITIFITPSWKSFILFVGFMAFIPSIIFLMVRFVDFKKAGIGYRGGAYTISFSRGFTLHTLVIPEEKVIKIKIKQTFFQRHSGRCDLYLYTVAEGMKRHRCRSLSKRSVEEFFYGS